MGGLIGDRMGLIREGQLGYLSGVDGANWMEPTWGGLSGGGQHWQTRGSNWVVN